MSRELKCEAAPFPLFIVRDFTDESPNVNAHLESRDKTLKYAEMPRGRLTEQIEFLIDDVLEIIKPLENDYHFKLPSNTYFTFIFMTASTGYKLLPHNDGRERLISGMIYLGKPESGGSLGFYDCPNESGLPHLMEGDHKEFLRVEPDKGTLVCWLNTYNSYHDVSPVTGTRNSIYFSLDSPNQIWLSN